MRPTTIILTAVLSLVPRVAQAQHWLFDPTPREEMRELSTDRPDQTESPHSVDPGHLQAEMEVMSVEVMREDGEDATEIVVMGSSFRLGILPFADLQLVVQPEVVRRARTANGMELTSRFGDTTARLKIAVFGNDGGPFALGLLPFVTFPSDGSDVEAGLAVPMGVELPEAFELGLMAQLDVVRVDQGYGASLLGTATVGRTLVGDLAAFVEISASTMLSSTPGARFEVHGGLVYAVSPDVQLDLGAYGVVVGGDSIRLFLGLTTRI